MTIRERWEDIERRILSPQACLSVNSRGRERPEESCAIRTCFQRDRDRIIHCKSFRRLKYKTQVLLLPEGDHYRTRLTHTLEVSQIARSIARALALNEDLTEAIALGHDLGHTPFGHMGERVLDRLARENGLDGFHHAAQSLRVVDCLEKDGRGLNLTWEVRMGIIQHSKGQVDVRSGYELASPSSMEAWVVRVSDSLAYLNHDIDDALRAGLLDTDNLPDDMRALTEMANSKRINGMIVDVVENSTPEAVRFSGEMLEQIEKLRGFLYEHVYSRTNAIIEESRVEHVITALFERRMAKNGGSAREAVDMISGMTDRFALHLFQESFVPSPWPKPAP
ncbi:MAG: deoxyguanosinetriphosphate triphosphohydrolase [Synergistaceae bacterium]|nr:deoxyguanosinetriphosphate triphosphohydrolase [Synergistaceae bacterium]